MRGADGCRELEVLADREMLVEGVFLRDITDVALELIEIFVERAVVQQDLALRRLKLPAEHFHKRAFAGAARAHHANELAAIHRERNAFESDLVVAESMRDVHDFE